MNNDYQNAVNDNPDGAVCSFCNEPNTFCDDIGWFYMFPYSESIGRRVLPPCPDGVPREGYTCEKCWNGPHGVEHRSRYGDGDR